jgi:uncharacterized lipoprotein YehR (DUF1307 family)
MMKLTSILIAGAAVVALAGCGEKPQTVGLKDGATSAAKKDDLPYNNDQFKNDRTSWERTLRARADHQNEYKRVN